MRPPIPPLESHIHNPISIDIMKDMIYNKDSDLNKMTLSKYQGNKSTIIDNLVESMYKLTVLNKTLSKFDKAHHVNHIQPYFDDKQHLRCYISDSYIVVEISADPKAHSNWTHIIESHGANKKTSKYNFSIVPNLSTRTIEKITIGIEMVIETVEKHIFSVMGKTNTVFEQLNTIRIGKKTVAEIEYEEQIRFKERQRLEKELKQQKKLDRKKYWAKILHISPKIKFT